MKIDLSYLFLAVLAICIYWEGQRDKDRCFEALKANIKLEDCK